ncbi:carboxypeptidase-like regulatory domain-containing protein [Owenweeksia hongkongensis]|uniref:carboxypeptidase-like regulatory domain-containing protein n=1 Tax=Owenweeksia hongkongensis TaxID=253245 RepID=UPI003A8CA00D
MKVLIVILLSVILFTSCTKADNDDDLNGHTIVEGQLLDASTLEPIAAGTVIIEYGSSKMDTTTGSNGDYRFDFVHEDKYAYYITATADKYFGNDNVGIWYADYPSGKPSPVQRIELGHLNKMDVKLPPEGYINIHMKQVDPYSGTIQFRLGYDYIGSHGVNIYNGSGLNTNELARVPANRYNGIRYAIIRDADSLQYVEDSVYVPRFDTVNYTIEF